MSEVYDIHLFDRVSGRYCGSQNCQLDYDVEKYDITTISPPATDKLDGDWWHSINCPYWTGNGWELRSIEE